MPGPMIHRYTSWSELLGCLTSKIATCLETAIKTHSSTALVLSGGSTPASLYSELSNTPLEWSKVTVTLSDERWVAPDSPASNQHLLKSTLLRNHAKKANFVPLLGSSNSLPDTLTERNKAIARISHPYSCTLLGMGNDGHTASLFPCAPELEQGMKSTEALVSMKPTQAEYTRISMTLQELTRTDSIILLIRGQDKWSTFEEAMKTLDPNSTNQSDQALFAMPIRAVLTQKVAPVEVHWSP